MKRIIGLLFISISILLIASCNDENENLVNPPAKNNTVFVRYINLSADLLPRELVLDKTVSMGVLNYANVSKAIRPPADSSFLKIKNNGADEFSQSLPIKYFRKTNYTFYIMNSKLCDGCKADTIITLRTTSSIDELSTDAFLKVINAVPDSTISYALRYGCPSGEPLFANVPYKSAVSTGTQVTSGKVPISLVRLKKVANSTVEEFVNLYELNLESKSQYTLILKKGDIGNEDLLILDENDSTSNALKPVLIVNERTTNVRGINLSSEKCDIIKKGGSLVSTNLSPLNIGKYASLNACQSKSRDSIEIFVNNQLTSTAIGSLDVLSKYSLIVTDSANKKASKSYIVPPHKYRYDYSDKTLIRVLHTNHSLSGLTVSLGARVSTLEANKVTGFSSGTVLANNLQNGDLSDLSVIESGEAPISIFTTSEPVRLVYNANSVLEKGKSYTLVVSQNDKSEIVCYLISDEIENQPIQLINEGVFVQFINTISDVPNVKVNLQGLNSKIVNDGVVSYTGSLATVVQKGSQKISVNGTEYTFNAELGKRIFLISSGKSSALEIFENKFEPTKFDNYTLTKYRFINASSDVPMLNIREFSADSTIIVRFVGYKDTSDYKFENRTKVISYYLFNGDDGNYIHQLSDLTVSSGRSYALIFAGNKGSHCNEHKTNNTEPNCYAIIIQQEF